MGKKGNRRRKSSSGAKSSASSGSQAAKLSKKDSGTEEERESVMDVADNQKIKESDSVEIACDTPAEMPEAAKVDKDIEVGKEREKATSGIPATAPSTAKVDKDDTIKVGKDSDRATSDIPAATPSTAKVDKDDIIKVGKDRERATSDIPAATPSTAKVDKGDIIEVDKDSKKATNTSAATPLKAKVDKREIIKVGKDIDKASSDIPATTPSTSKVDKDDIIEVDKDIEKVTSDNKGDESRRKELIKSKTKTNPELATGVLMLKSPESADSKRHEKGVAKTKLAPAKAFLVCAPPIQYPNDELCLSIKAPKLKDIDERKQLLDPKASKTQQELSSDNDWAITDSKEGIIPHSFQHSKDDVEQVRHLDLKALKFPQPVASEMERITAAFKIEGHEMEFWELALIFFFEKAQKMDLEALKTELRHPSESSLVLKAYQLIQELDRKLKTGNASTTAEGLYSECEKTITETEFGGNLSEKLLEYFRNILKKKLNSESQTSGMQPELSPENEKIGTDPKTGISESKSLLQDPELKNIDERIRSMDLSALEWKQGVPSEYQFKLSEPIIQKCEEIINLEREASLNFEFDENGEKRIMVDNAVQYIIDAKHKITFNIGDGKAKLSFIDNKVLISTQGGQVDCSMQKNRIVFTLMDSTLKSDALPESPRATQFQTRLEDSVNDFCKSVKTACNEFENSFLKSLQKGTDATYKE